MIVLDTSVISEMTKARPAPAVEAWLNEQPLETLFLTSISVAEIGFAIACLPKGKRRDALTVALEQTVQLFSGGILKFDQDAALAYARLADAAQQAGLGFPASRGYIAAIAVSHEFAFATRDTAPFEAGHLEIINPWEAP